MKTFAIMLLMLFGVTFLKAQTMVVETADSVESFEVGEIKSLNAFEKDYSKVKIEFQNIPIKIVNLKSDTLNFNYTNWQASEPQYSLITFKNDTIIGTHGPYMRYVFITEIGPGGSGSDVATLIRIVFQENLLEDFYFWTSGSRGGCPDNNGWLQCSIYGNFEIGLQNAKYKIDSSGLIKAVVTAQEIIPNVYHFQHSEKEYVKSIVSRKVDFLKIRKEDLTDDSQIIITIE